MAKEEVEIELAKIQEIKEQQEESLLALPNVVGVGMGYKAAKGKTSETACISVYVEEKVAVKQLAPDEIIPRAFENVKTDVVEVGVIEAHAFTAKVRPAVPGYSMGHFQITAGTFGCLVRDICSPCGIHILSNNHVLANSNSAIIGHPILQPGPVDGGVFPRDFIARLSRFVPLQFNNPSVYNLVDAALARPRNQRDIIASIVGLGIPKGTVEATLGMHVIKSGRTTQTTAGKVIGLNATVAVGYGSSGTAYFRNQVITTDMSQGGDSGSLLLSRTTREATGLLFAGSSTVTIHNNISNVLMALGVEMVTA